MITVNQFLQQLESVENRILGIGDNVPIRSWKFYLQNENGVQFHEAPMNFGNGKLINEAVKLLEQKPYRVILKLFPKMSDTPEILSWDLVFVKMAEEVEEDELKLLKSKPIQSGPDAMRVIGQLETQLQTALSNLKTTRADARELVRYTTELEETIDKLEDENELLAEELAKLKAKPQVLTLIESLRDGSPDLFNLGVEALKGLARQNGLGIPGKTEGPHLDAYRLELLKSMADLTPIHIAQLAVIVESQTEDPNTLPWLVAQLNGESQEETDELENQEETGDLQTTPPPSASLIQLGELMPEEHLIFWISTLQNQALTYRAIIELISLLDPQDWQILAKVARIEPNALELLRMRYGNLTMQPDGSN